MSGSGYYLRPVCDTSYTFIDFTTTYCSIPFTEIQLLKSVIFTIIQLTASLLAFSASTISLHNSISTRHGVDNPTTHRERTKYHHSHRPIHTRIRPVPAQTAPRSFSRPLHRPLASLEPLHTNTHRNPATTPRRPRQHRAHRSKNRQCHGSRSHQDNIFHAWYIPKGKSSLYTTMSTTK